MYYTHFELKLSTRPIHEVRYLFSMKPLVVDLCAVWCKKEQRRNSNIFSSEAKEIFYFLIAGTWNQWANGSENNTNNFGAPNEHFEAVFLFNREDNDFLEG